MALYQWSVPGDAAGASERAQNAVAYAGTLHVASRLAGDKRTSVTPTVDSLRAFLTRHADADCVRRAIADQQPAKAVLAAAGADQGTGSRWARPTLSSATMLFIDEAAVAAAAAALSGGGAEERPVPIVCRVTASGPARDAQDGLLSVGAYGTVAAAWEDDAAPPTVTIPMPPVLNVPGKGSTRRKRKQVDRDDDGDEAAEADDDGEDDFTFRPAAAAAAAAAGSGGGESEEPEGDDLAEFADEDDAESLGTYEADGFVVSDDDGDEDDENTDWGEDDSDSESSLSSEKDDVLADAAVPAPGGDVDVMAPFQPSPLARQHPVPAFDGVVYLWHTGKLRLGDGSVVEANHTYTVRGAVGYTSTTTVIAEYMSGFDAAAKSASMVRSPNWPFKHEYRAPAEAWATTQLRARWQAGTYEGDRQGWTGKLRAAAALFVDGKIGFDVLRETMQRSGVAQAAALAGQLYDQWQDLCAEHVRSVWTLAGDLGTAMHERIEHFFEGLVDRQTLEQRDEPELRQFFRWHDEWLVPNGYVPYRMELPLYDDELRMCGSVDALFWNPATGDIIMVDWKRAKSIETEPYGDDKDKRCTGPLASLLDTKFVKYTMQQNMYRYMLHKHTPLRLSAMYLLKCHPNQGTEYRLMPVPVEEEATAALVAARIATAAQVA